MSAVTNALGQVVEQYRYDAFGQPEIRSGPFAGSPDGELQSGTLVNNRFLFTGREWAAQYGFYEFRNRAYNPRLGRFMSEDPKGFAAGDRNLFRYCGGDPVNRVDPMGTIEHVIGGWEFDGSHLSKVVAQDDGNDGGGSQKRSDQPAGNDNKEFYSDVSSFAHKYRPDGQSINPEDAAHALVSDTRQDAGLVADNLRRDKLGQYGVERATSEFASGKKLAKMGPDVGLDARYSPRAYLPKAPNGMSERTVPFLGIHAHGPQSGRGHENLDESSAKGAFTHGVPYISAVGSSNDRGTRVQILIPTYGYYHTSNGVDFLQGR